MTDRNITKPTFSERVYTIISQIPAGRVCTYGDVARILGSKSARAVGQALNRNPYAPKVPCHRVVGHDGALTGYAGGLDAKQRLLESEGVAVSAGNVNLAQYRFEAFR